MGVWLREITEVLRQMARCGVAENVKCWSRRGRWSRGQVMYGAYQLAVNVPGEICTGFRVLGRAVAAKDVAQTVFRLDARYRRGVSWNFWKKVRFKTISYGTSNLISFVPVLEGWDVFRPVPGGGNTKKSNRFDSCEGQEIFSLTNLV